MDQVRLVMTLSQRMPSFTLKHTHRDSLTTNCSGLCRVARLYARSLSGRLLRWKPCGWTSLRERPRARRKGRPCRHGESLAFWSRCSPQSACMHACIMLVTFFREQKACAGVCRVARQCSLLSASLLPQAKQDQAKQEPCREAVISKCSGCGCSLAEQHAALLRRAQAGT